VAHNFFAGLVIEEGEEGDLRVRHHSVGRDDSTLPMDVALNVTTEQQQQQDLIDAELLDSQVNGGIETQVHQLGRSQSLGLLFVRYFHFISYTFYY